MLKDIPVEYFSVIYDFIMSGELSIEQDCPRYLIEIMKLSSYFMLDELEALCTKMMLKYISDYTVLDLYLLSQIYGLNCLGETTIKYLGFRNSEVLSTPECIDHMKKYGSKEIQERFAKDLLRYVKENIVMISDFHHQKTDINPITKMDSVSYIDDLSDLLS